MDNDVFWTQSNPDLSVAAKSRCDSNGIKPGTSQIGFEVDTVTKISCSVSIIPHLVKKSDKGVANAQKHKAEALTARVQVPGRLGMDPQ